MINTKTLPLNPNQDLYLAVYAPSLKALRTQLEAAESFLFERKVDWIRSEQEKSFSHFWVEEFIEESWSEESPFMVLLIRDKRITHSSIAYALTGFDPDSDLFRFWPGDETHLDVLFEAMEKGYGSSKNVRCPNRPNWPIPKALQTQEYLDYVDSLTLMELPVPEATKREARAFFNNLIHKPKKPSHV